MSMPDPQTKEGAEIIMKDGLDRFEKFIQEQLKRNIDLKKSQELKSGNPHISNVERAIAREEWISNMSNEHCLRMVLEVFQWNRKMMNI